MQKITSREAARQPLFSTQLLSAYETKHSMNVLQCVYNVDDLDITSLDQVTLENAHYRKIELSDAIYVVDIQGYIGNQVSKEIAFAESKGKEVILHSAFKRGN